MTIPNAIKKLEKNGFKVEESKHIKGRYIATLENNRHHIEFIDQDGEVIVIDLRTKGHDDDVMTDYHAGIFCDNISQAIRLCY
jgi:hypothetical protein